MKKFFVLNFQTKFQTKTNVPTHKAHLKEILKIDSRRLISESHEYNDTTQQNY